MKIRTQFTARVAGFRDLPGRTRKRERYVELAGVTAVEGGPWFSSMQVPYRGGLARAEVKEGDTIAFTATLTGEESDAVLSYVFDVVVRPPVVPIGSTSAVAQPVVPTPATAAAPPEQVTESFTARVGEYSLLPRSEGTKPERYVELKDVTDTAGAIRLDSTLVPCALLGRRFISMPGDEIRFTAVLAEGRLNGITEIETVRYNWKVMRANEAG